MSRAAPRYACRPCENGIVQTPAPAHLIPSGIPTEATLTAIAQGRKQSDIDALLPWNSKGLIGERATSIIELKITLDYIEAVVTRTLQVPADIRLDVLKLAKRWKPKDTRLS